MVQSAVPTVESMRVLHVALVQSGKAPMFDHALASGKGTIVANVLNEVRVQEAREPLKMETPFWPYVLHKWTMQLVLVTWFHNRPPESHILVTDRTVGKGTPRVS